MIRNKFYIETHGILFTLSLDSMLFFIVMVLFFLLVAVLTNIQPDWICRKEVLLWAHFLLSKPIHVVCNYSLILPHKFYTLAIGAFLVFYFIISPRFVKKKFLYRSTLTYFMNRSQWTPPSNEYDFGKKFDDSILSIGFNVRCLSHIHFSVRFYYCFDLIFVNLFEREVMRISFSIFLFFWMYVC